MPLPPNYFHLLSLAQAGLGLIPQRERADADELLSLVDAHFDRGETDPGTWKRDLGRLIEVLARRSASAMPYAALGRAMLADLHADQRQVEELLREFEMKMAQHGL